MAGSGRGWYGRGLIALHISCLSTWDYAATLEDNAGCAVGGHEKVGWNTSLCIIRGAPDVHEWEVMIDLSFGDCCELYE